MATPAVPLTERAARRGYASARLCPQLDDGAHTTVHVAAYARERTDLRVVVLRRPETLASWCARTAVQDAIVGGFFVREPRTVPLGEVRTRGVGRRHTPFLPPWDAERACVHVEGGEVRLAPRSEVAPRPRGDLLQAGPLLVAGGRSLITDGRDPEGFAAGSEQFDSDITVGRYPRTALGIGRGLLWAVACDGRAPRDAGMTLAELAQFMLELGADSAINLDGGGSASLVCGGSLVNRPRESHGVDLPNGRPVCTALAFLPKA